VLVLSRFVGCQVSYVKSCFYDRYNNKIIYMMFRAAVPGDWARTQKTAQSQQQNYP